MSDAMGDCSCGCGESGCVQQKIYTALVRSCTDCSSIANAIAFVNANFSSVSPLTLAWGSHPVGWQYVLQDTFDAPASTSPDLGDREVYDGPIGDGFEYQNISTASVDGSGTGVVTRTAFLLPATQSTIVLVAAYYDSSNAYLWQSACTMAGVATGCGYVFDIPIPPIDLCASSEAASMNGGGPNYNVFVSNRYSGTFADFVWGDFACLGGTPPSNCNPSITATPSACLTPDPFYGDDPP